MTETLTQFKAYLNQIQTYNQAIAQLQWDLHTSAPRNSLDSKTQALTFFSTESFRLSTAPEFGSLLETLSQPAVFDTLDAAMQVTVKRSQRDYLRFKRVPEDFYTEYTTAGARSGQAWVEAKKAKDFSVFAPHLEKMISMTKQYVNYMEPDKDPYEVLLDIYEEGMDSAAIDRIFAQMKEGLRPLLDRINAAPKPDLSALEGSYDVEAQKKVQHLLLEYIGFDFESGAVGESEHPFTMKLCPGDVRVTNHFSETLPLSSIYSAIHEGGHAIFEQNVDPAYAQTAVDDINLMGLHESQSRFYENILGRNKNFWLPIYDRMGELLPQLKVVPLDTFISAANHVVPSLIRTEADEVTYCLHIILRYELEREIFRNDVPVDQLPNLWNDKMEELLGIRPENDADGILQDVHWSDGSFGYFPSYLLGSVYDGMFLNQLEKELGCLDTILAEGRIKEITKWLNEKIHRHGSLYTSSEVIQRICGCEISAQPLLDYFEKKYM